MEPIALKREGSDYRDDSIDELTKFPSATMLRKYAYENGLDDKFADIVPKETFEALLKASRLGKAPVKMSNIDSAIIAHLRLLDASRLGGIADIGGGLGEKILSSSHKVSTYEELVAISAGKHYTEARTRRAILNILTEVTFNDLKAYPTYTTVLGFNDKGRELLSELRKKEKRISFVTKPADAERLGETAARQIYLDRRADSLFTLATPKKTDSGEYIKKHPFVK
jgi:predicted nucleotidyltransferase